MNELMNELSSAMRYNPGLNVMEVIKQALELKYHWLDISDKKIMKHKVSNED
jgi:hypothetical protein